MSPSFLKFLRETNGLTQQQLGEALQKPQSRIAEWENGTHKVPRWMRPELAAMGWIVNVNDARLPEKQPKEVRQLFKQRNTAPEEAIEAIDEQILTILLAKASRSA